MEDKAIYIKRNIDRDIWLKARADALRQGKTIVEWMNEAIQEKLSKK